MLTISIYWQVIEFFNDFFFHIELNIGNRKLIGMSHTVSLLYIMIVFLK